MCAHAAKTVLSSFTFVAMRLVWAPILRCSTPVIGCAQLIAPHPVYFLEIAYLYD